LGTRRLACIDPIVIVLGAGAFFFYQFAYVPARNDPSLQAIEGAFRFLKARDLVDVAYESAADVLATWGVGSLRGDGHVPSYATPPALLALGP